MTCGAEEGRDRGRRAKGAGKGKGGEGTVSVRWCWLGWQSGEESRMGMKMAVLCESSKGEQGVLVFLRVVFLCATSLLTWNHLNEHLSLSQVGIFLFL